MLETLECDYCLYKWILYVHMDLELKSRSAHIPNNTIPAV